MFKTCFHLDRCQPNRQIASRIRNVLRRILQSEFLESFRTEPRFALVGVTNHRRPTSGNRLSRFERLEDRSLLATFSESGSILQIDLAANESVAVTSTGTQYSLALTGGAYTGTNSANVTGNGTSSLTITAASFTEVKIDDAGASTSVVFNNSGANTYGSSFRILLDNTAAGAVTFNGTTAFVGSSAFSATTTRNILVNSGASLSTVDGNLTLSANQQAIATSGNFFGVRIGSTGTTVANVSVSGSGLLSVSGRGGTDTSGSQIGVYVYCGRIMGGSSTVSVTGTGGASTGNGNHGVTVQNDFNRANEGIITSTGGNVTVTGTGGGSGTSSFSFGVQGSAGSQTNPATISAGSTGTVTVSGTGASNVSATFPHHGVSFQGQITSGGGNVFVTGNVASTALDGSYGINATNNCVITTATNGGNITILVNTVSFSGGTVSTNASGSVTVASSVPGRGIDIGTNSDPIAGPIGISPSVELQSFRTQNLIFGDSNTGAITVSGNVSQLGIGTFASYNLSLVSGVGISLSGGSIDTKGGNLSIRHGSGSNATFTKSGNDATLGTTGTIGTLSFFNNSNLGIVINGATVDGGYNQLNVVGKVDLTGTNLVLSGSFVPTTQSFVIVSNDGVDAVTGTFNGLAEGATVTFNGANMTLTYAGGDGNDVVLLPPATLNATATLSSGNLTIADTAGVANTFRVTTNAGNLIVTEANGNGFSSIPPEATLSVDGRTMTIPQTAVTGTLTVNASGGNDSIVLQGVTGSMNIVVDGGIGTDVVNVGAGGVSLTAGNIAATAETINVGDAVGTSSGTINLAGNAISILAAVNAGSNSVTLRSNSSSAINLGAADSAGTLGLTDAELDLVTAGTIIIGDSNTTGATISADITRASSTPISITSAGAINFTTGLINTAGGNLTLSPGAAGVGVAKTGVDLNLGAGTLSFANNSNLNFSITGATLDTQYQQLNVIGQVNLTGVNFVRTGAYVPTLTNSFTLVNNDGVDPIIGNFNGLVEGATVTVNGVNMTITYLGGDGNDVALLPPPSTTATLSSGILTIADTSLSGIANSYTATVVGPNLVITDSSGAIFGTPPAGGVLSNNNQTLTIPLSSVSSLVVNGGLLNDTINIQGLNGTLNLSVDGGAGTDTTNFQTTASSITGSVTVTSESVNVNVALSSNNNDITINATTLLSPSTINAGTGKALLAGQTAGTPIMLQDNSFAATGGGTNADTVFASATDADGNIYVAGVANTAIKDFNGTSVTGFGSDDIYVAKFNRAGVQQWFKLAGSVFQDSVSALTVDLAGNVYVAGTVPTTTTDFAGNTLATYGQQDVYVAKLNTNGVQQWFKLSGSTNTDSVTAISVDSSGNLIVAGTITGTAGNTPRDFNGTTVSGYQFSDVFVAKLNASGVQQWYKIAGSTSFDSVSVVTTDITGNVYVAGVVVGGSTPKDFNGVNTASYGSNEIFIAKLDSVGTQQWFNIAGSTGADTIAALTIDAGGNVYVGGLINGTAANAPKDFAGTTVTGVGGSDTWLAKLNGSGVQQWFKLSGSTSGSDTLTAITIDGSGNIYATGTIDTTVSSSPKDFNLTTVTGYLNSDVYVAKLDSNGDQQWFKLTGSSNADSVASLLLDSSNNVYVAGHIGGSNSPRDFNGTAVTGIGNFDVFVAKLSTSGVQQWFRLGGFSAVDNVGAMQLDASGNVYLTGIFNSQTTAGRDFAGNTIANPTGIASSDIYVARISTAGIQQQFDLIGSTSGETVRTLRIDTSGNAFVTGQFSGTIDFDSGPGVVSRISNGGLDAFVWRLPNLSNATISDAALDQVTAATVQIGNATAGPITVASNQTRPTATNVELVSGSSISFTSGSFDTAGGNLKLTPGTGSNATAPKAGVDVNLGSTGTLSFGSSSNLAFDIRGTTVDTQFDQLNVVGKVDLSGANLVLTGAFAPSPGDSFKIIDNDGTTDPIVGSFAGLAQGATVTFNGIPLTISYTGGDGNDVVLTYSVSNTPPTAVVLTPSSASLAESTSTVSAIVLSTISITDDGQGTNTLSLSGADASFFEIVGNQLRLMAGTQLDFETKTSFSVRVEADDTSVGSTPDAFADFALTITDVNAPTISGVFVSGSTWSSTFIDAIDGGGTGAGNGLGYAMTSGLIIANADVDRIYIQFSEPMVGFNASTFQLLGVDTADYAGLTSVSYDSMNHRGVIQLSSSINRDKLRIGISDSVTNAGLLALDGDANDSPGGVFDFRFNVLVGDASGEGSVNGSDLSLFVTSFNQSTGNIGYNPRADWNHDGSVNGGDLTLFANNYNVSLPINDPNPIVFSPPQPSIDESYAPIIEIDEYFSELDEEDWFEAYEHE